MHIHSLTFTVGIAAPHGQFADYTAQQAAGWFLCTRLVLYFVAIPISEDSASACGSKRIKWSYTVDRIIGINPRNSSIPSTQKSVQNGVAYTTATR